MVEAPLPRGLHHFAPSGFICRRHACEREYAALEGAAQENSVAVYAEVLAVRFHPAHAEGRFYGRTGGGGFQFVECGREFAPERGIVEMESCGECGGACGRFVGGFGGRYFASGVFLDNLNRNFAFGCAGGGVCHGYVGSDVAGGYVGSDAHGFKLHSRHNSQCEIAKHTVPHGLCIIGVGMAEIVDGDVVLTAVVNRDFKCVRTGRKRRDVEMMRCGEAFVGGSHRFAVNLEGAFPQHPFHGETQRFAGHVGRDFDGAGIGARTDVAVLAREPQKLRLGHGRLQRVGLSDACHVECAGQLHGLRLFAGERGSPFAIELNGLCGEACGTCKQCGE